MSPRNCKKILFHIFDLNYSGGIKVLFTLGNLLKQKGYEITYLVADKKSKLPFPSECEFLFSESPLKSFLQKIWWLSQHSYSADIVVATYFPTAYSVYFNKSSVARKLYYVQAFEPAFFTDSPLRLIRYLYRYLLARFSYFLPLDKIVNCRESARGLSNSEVRRAPEIPPGVDPLLFHVKNKGSNSLLTIGHISRRENIKGSPDFFKAMKILREGGHRFKVVIAYDLCRKTYGLEYEAVTPCSDKELAEYYSSMDIVISTARHKGFGYPPLETMACGSLCISTPMDYGLPWIDHVPINAEDPKSIANAVSFVIDNPEAADKIRQAGIVTASKYSWTEILKRWMVILTDESKYGSYREEINLKQD